MAIMARKLANMKILTVPLDTNNGSKHITAAKTNHQIIAFFKPSPF